jgi:hypothetical protein
MQRRLMRITRRRNSQVEELLEISDHFSYRQWAARNAIREGPCWLMAVLTPESSDEDVRDSAAADAMFRLLHSCFGE